MAITAEDVRREIDEDALVFVLDDDPTGTQSIAGLPVLTRWAAADLRWAIRTGARGVYVLTNTRALDEDRVAERVRDVVRVAVSEATRAGRRPVFVSRSDSTLRGHFPLETDLIAAELAEVTGRAPDLTLVIPAFPEAGRITVDAVHYCIHDGFAIPVGETPFASDATFGYASSNLRDWVCEKTRGRITPQEVILLSVRRIRAGVSAVEALLSAAPPGATIVVDAVEEGDMRVLAAAIRRLEAREVLLRVGPPYVRAHIGQEPPAVVSADRLEFGSALGGLVIVGSHVPLTTAQLTRLIEDRAGTAVVELDVHRLLERDVDAYLRERANEVAHALRGGDVVVHTSRELMAGRDGAESLGIARSVSRGMVDLVRLIIAETLPRFIVAKGGITSSDIASEALGIRRAMVVGPMLPGVVSLWRPESGAAVGVPYVVFPGNVGDERSLVDVVSALTSPAATQT